MWLGISLFSALFAATTNHIDKYLLSKFFKGGSVGVLMIFSGLIGGFVTLGLSFFRPEVMVVQTHEALTLILSGVIYLTALFFYFQALDLDETSIVAPLFLLIPLISLVLGRVFLQETITALHLLAGFFITAGAFVLALDTASFKFKLTILGLMSIASLLLAINGLLFKLIALETSFLSSLFWEYIGFLAVAVALWSFVPSYRRQFNQVLSKNSLFVLGLNGLNEVAAVIHLALYHLAALLAQLAVVQWVVEGIQPFFILGIGTLLSLFWPQIAKEDLSKQHVFRKLSALALMLIGTGLLANV